MILNSKLKTKPKNCVTNSNFKKKHASKSCSKWKNHNAICHPSPTMHFHIWSQLVLESSSIKTFYLVIPLQNFLLHFKFSFELEFDWSGLAIVRSGEGWGRRVLYPRLVLPTKSYLKPWHYITGWAFSGWVLGIKSYLEPWHYTRRLSGWVFHN